jgi:hypothetical protein
MFLQCCYIDCATEYKAYPAFFNLQCLLQCLNQYVVCFNVLNTAISIVNLKKAGYTLYSIAQPT